MLKFEYSTGLQISSHLDQESYRWYTRRPMDPLPLPWISMTLLEKVLL